MKNKVLLSQFVTNGFIVLTLKNTKGLNKVVRFGAVEHKVKTFCIKMYPNLDTDLFNYEVKDNNFQFVQNKNGKVRIKINTDFSIDCVESDSLENYIESEFLEYNEDYSKKEVVKKKIPLELI